MKLVLLSVSVFVICCTAEEEYQLPERTPGPLSARAVRSAEEKYQFLKLGAPDISK